MTNAATKIADNGSPSTSRKTYCIIPRDLAESLHELLRKHFADDQSVEVVVELRTGERRQATRRTDGDRPPARADRRKVRSPTGRRVGERRAMQVAATPLRLPRKSRRYADRLQFVERLQPANERSADAQAARLVLRFQSGDRSAFDELYLQYFDAVYTYARVAMRDHHGAEDLAQQVFIRVLQGLSRYQRRSGTPFRAWLFSIARNEVLNHFKKAGRLEVEDPARVVRRHDSVEPGPSALDWLSDNELALLIDRLPLAQRQVLALRYRLGLTTNEMSKVLGRTPAAVRKLEHRAVRLLEQRLTAIGRRSTGSRRAPMLTRVKRAPVLAARRFVLAQSAPAARYGRTNAASWRP